MKNEIIKIIAELLQVSEEMITEDTLMDDVETWDSLTHVMLIGELEAQLDISIPLDEAVEVTGVKDLLELCGVEE